MTKKNIVDEIAGPVKIRYKYHFYYLFIKPIAIAAVTFALFLLGFVYQSLDFTIVKDPKQEALLRSSKVRLAMKLISSGFEAEFSRVSKLVESLNVSTFDEKLVNGLFEKLKDVSIASLGEYSEFVSELTVVYQEKMGKLKVCQADVVLARKESDEKKKAGLVEKVKRARNEAEAFDAKISGFLKKMN